MFEYHLASMYCAQLQMSMSICCWGSQRREAHSGVPRVRESDMAVVQGSNTGAHVPDTEAYTGAFDFVAPRNPSDSGPRPLVQGSSLSRGFALPLQGAGTPPSTVNLARICAHGHLALRWKCTPVYALKALLQYLQVSERCVSRMSSCRI